MNQDVTSRNRLIHGENYVLVVEEVFSPETLHEMFQQMCYLIAGGDKIVEELGESLQRMAGLQFVVIHYYERFVSPSTFQGYSIVILTEFPHNIHGSVKDMIKEMLEDATDDELARLFLAATRNDEDQSKINVLKEVTTKITTARIKSLRSI